jgi:hypothetical protein
VVAENPETIDALHDYLSRAGVSLRSSRQLLEVGSIAAHARALVLFPDEFELRQVSQVLALARSVRARLPILLITGAPQRFTAALDLTPPPIVLPKPAFGWTILEAIRTHARPSKA